jgi:diguanylate cyclase
MAEGISEGSRDLEWPEVPIEPVLLVLAVLSNTVVLLSIVVIGVLLVRRAPQPAVEPPPRPDDVSTVQLAAGITGQPQAVTGEAIPRDTFDRLVRIVAWILILAIAAIVAVSDLWPDNAPAIYVVLVVAAISVLILLDILPPRLLGRLTYVIEGAGSLVFATLIVYLTGREASPFFFIYPLIVAGAALIVRPAVTFVLAVIASAMYLVAVFADWPIRTLDATGWALVAINLTALLLLATVASVIANEQKRMLRTMIGLATVDAVTGLCNRSFFFAALEREIARSGRSGRGFCVIMMDLDDLKTINDRFGHNYGDKALRAVGEVIRVGVRKTDTAARYGGDEFAVLLPETDPSGAYVLAEKVRQQSSDMSIPGPRVALRLSLSIGVVAFPEDGRTADQLMFSADQAMYSAKRAGKNRVAAAPVGPAPLGPVGRLED